MAICRVYLFTYNRNGLLKRAISSLINQTVTDWICELHNDLPGNTFPENYIDTLNDKRFIIKTHPENLGTTKSFNLAYGGCTEKYASILEDDNWWEPTFLEEMINVMETNTDLDIGWSNMRIWKEEIDQTWCDTGRTIWPTDKNVLFEWAQPVQALGCLHSTGAMIYRGSKAKDYQIPGEALSNAVELIRERSFKHPIYLHSKILANFSQTQVTSQSGDSVKWTGTQTMLLASYINSSVDITIEFKRMLEFYRKYKPSPIANFFLANCFYLKKSELIFNFNLSDWYTIVKWCFANLFKLRKLVKYLNQQRQTWDYLKRQTINLGNQINTPPVQTYVNK